MHSVITLMLAAGVCRLTYCLWWTAPMLFRQAQPSVNAALGFSHMNIIVSDTRSMLLVSHVSSLLFIKLHGPPLKSWNPNRYTKTWLQKHRSATDTQTRIAASQDKTKDPLWQVFWRVCRPKLFKNLCLSLVSGAPPPLLFLGLHPWSHILHADCC